jgi:hypothetical protein
LWKIGIFIEVYFEMVFIRMEEILDFNEDWFIFIFVEHCYFLIIVNVLVILEVLVILDILIFDPRG